MDSGWIFDDSVADRFHNEAIGHIPSYEIVIQKSIDLANLVCSKDDFIIDVGSATGYTVKKFIENGFVNTYGVENSLPMIKKSFYQERIIYSNVFPKNMYKFVIMNWTLHFINNKEKYIVDIFENLDTNGYFILTEKIVQSQEVKQMYYNFKLRNNVSQDYIIEKEKKLKNVMFCCTLDYYLELFKKLRVSYEIIHADLGFTTFLLRKPV